MFATFRFKLMIGLAALCVLTGVLGVSRAAAQDDPTASSPLVGTWVMPPMGEESGSITQLSSDGNVIDSETDGMWAIGTWEATGPDTGIMTFVFFLNEPADDFTGSIIVRATLTYDSATDTITASYTATGAMQDGSVFFSDDAPTEVTLTRFSAQGPDQTGAPIEGLVPVMAGTPTA